MAAVTGQPAPTDQNDWHVMYRPADGSDLRWQILEARSADGKLTFNTPANLLGLYDIAVRLGTGPINWTDRASSCFSRRRWRPSASSPAESLTTSITC